MKKTSLANLAYVSVALFALVNAVIFVMSLLVEVNGSSDITRYLHYNLVLAVGFVLVFMIGRYSQSAIGLAIALFLFIIGLLVSQEMPENLPQSYVAGWSMLKWVLVAPILTAFIAFIIGKPEIKNQDPQKPNFHL